MFVITQIDPGPKNYQIKPFKKVYLCYPTTEAEYLELLLVYNGNNIQGNLDLSFSNISELPDNLIVHEELNISFSTIAYIPNNVVVNGDFMAYGIECLKEYNFKIFGEIFN